MAWGVFIRKIRKHRTVSEANPPLSTRSNNPHQKKNPRTYACILSNDAGSPVVDMRAILEMVWEVKD